MCAIRFYAFATKVGFFAVSETVAAQGFAGV
jgi:hypothetical protein